MKQLPQCHRKQMPRDNGLIISNSVYPKKLSTVKKNIVLPKCDFQYNSLAHSETPWAFAFIYFVLLTFHSYLQVRCLHFLVISWCPQLVEVLFLATQQAASKMEAVDQSTSMGALADHVYAAVAHPRRLKVFDDAGWKHVEMIQ